MFLLIFYLHKRNTKPKYYSRKITIKSGCKSNGNWKDILKLQYPNGKLLYKNIGDYKKEYKALHKTTYSPNFDSTVIDLNAIDTSLYSNMYSFGRKYRLGILELCLLAILTTMVLQNFMDKWKIILHHTLILFHMRWMHKATLILPINMILIQLLQDPYLMWMAIQIMN